MAWYKFNSAQDFQLWHQNIKAALGLPNDEGTEQYTSGKVIADNDIRAWVEENLADKLQPCEAPQSLSFNDIPYEELF